MRWKTIVDDSFREHLTALKQFEEKQYEEEIAYVMNGLAHDVYFCPGDKYVTEKSKHDQFFICQHVNGWCGYRLGWYFEYSDHESVVGTVVIFMLPPDHQHQSYITLMPKDHLA